MITNARFLWATPTFWRAFYKIHSQEVVLLLSYDCPSDSVLNIAIIASHARVGLGRVPRSQ